MILSLKINDKSQTKIQNNFKGFWRINSNITTTYQTAFHRILCDQYTSSVHKHVRVSMCLKIIVTPRNY